MTVENDLKWDDKLEEIKNSLLGHFKENGYGVVIPSKKEDGSKEKEIKEITWFILTKEKGKSFQSNGFIVEKKDNLYTCKLKWWAGTKQNKERWAGVDKKKKEELTDDVQEKAVDSLISVCEKKWNGAEKPKDGNGQRGMNVKIADIPIELAENKEKLTREFVNPIFSWEKSNMQEFEYIQGELKKGRTESEIENIKQRLVKGIQMKEYIDLLLNNHNIILHGAPGTGKTHLAKDVAKQLIFGKDEVLIDKTDEELSNDSEKIEKRNKQETQFKDQFDFVQFHQSYDYTDFVEGLRPKDDGKGNIGFERRDGIFKKFCEKAIQSMNGVDNFKESYEKLLNCVEEKGQIEIPSLSDSFFAISLQENKNGFVISLKNDKGEYQETSWGYINFDQCYNIYKGLPGIPSENQDNYRKAIVKYMKDNLDLKDYVVGKNEPFIFVIDEINRGEMSKIFGELFYSIDPGYRGKDGAIKTQYANLQEEPNEFDLALGINKNEVEEDGKKHDSNKGKYGHFFVPKNVYVIGTMNDIDRSVESMDFAMRRRFAFEEIKAEDSKKMFDEPDSWKNGSGDIVPILRDSSDLLKKDADRNDENNIINRMNNLNNAILYKDFNLNSSYQIGGAYFLKFAYYYEKDNIKGAFESLWTNHIEGVLREYLRGMDKADDLLKKLKKAYDLGLLYEKQDDVVVEKEV